VDLRYDQIKTAQRRRYALQELDQEIAVVAQRAQGSERYRADARDAVQHADRLDCHGVNPAARRSLEPDSGSAPVRRTRLDELPHLRIARRLELQRRAVRGDLACDDSK